MEMLDCLVEDESKRKTLLVKAIEKHAKISQEAFTGQGFDRHMFVLKKLAAWRGDRVPNAVLFGNIYSNILSKNILSTSTVMNDFVDQASFGPVCEEGFGICYHMFADRIHYCITSYDDGKNDGKNSALKLGEALERALNDCIGLLKQNTK